jgi:hypothetical protein
MAFSLPGRLFAFCIAWCAVLPAADGPDPARWLSFGAQVRGRLEAPGGIGFKPDSNDTYYLNRLRFDVTVKPASWLRLFAQGQDTRAYFYDSGKPSGSMQDPWELRQGYAEIGGGETKGVKLRAGRQELIYAGGWLAATADWGITARVFDAAVLSLYRPGVKADLFASSVVQPDPERFDRHKPGEHFYGAYTTLDRLVRDAKLEPFLLLKTQLNALGEAGGIGNVHTYSGGARFYGNLPGGFDYTALVVRQWGVWAGDRISALGGNYVLGWTVSDAAWKPRVSVEYDIASGDRAARDGARNTFDQLYGAYHYFLGACDRLGWRNSRNLRGGVDFVPRRKWKVIASVRDLALDSARDGMYDYSGTRIVFNPKATSKHVGVEFDSWFVWQPWHKTAIEAGLGYLVPGAYLKQSTAGVGYLYQYVMVTRQL